MGTIRFIKRSIRDISQIKATPLEGIIKYLLKDALPESARVGTFFYTIDTQELFCGNGIGNELGHISDTMVFNKMSDFPTKGANNKIYIDETTKVSYFWDKDKYVKQSQDTVFYSSQYMTDKFVIQESGQTEFILTEKPISYVATIVNGISYSEGTHLIIDREGKKATWTYTEDNGGLNLDTGFKVNFTYRFINE